MAVKTYIVITFVRNNFPLALVTEILSNHKYKMIVKDLSRELFLGSVQFFQHELSISGIHRQKLQL